MERLPSLHLVLLLAIVFAGTPVGAAAQDTSSTTLNQQTASQSWLGFEGGHSTSGGFVTKMSANHARAPHLFSVRFIGESPGRGFLDGFFQESRFELGALYGRAARWDWGHASVGTGMAVVWEETGSGSVTWTTAGLPVQATLYLTVPYRPMDWLGVQVGGHANVNPENSFGGVTVGVVIGKLR